MTEKSLKEILAKLLKCPMVIESGVDGIWTWRKWSDGTAECWGKANYTITKWVQWGSWYYGEPYTSFYQIYPTNLFIEVPVCVTQVLSSSGGDMGFAKALVGTPLTTTPVLYPIRPISQTGGGFTMSYRAIGKWK